MPDVGYWTPDEVDMTFHLLGITRWGNELH